MNIKNKMIFLFFPLVFLSLSSCISIDTEIVIRQNLSGEALIRYSIAKSAINIGKIDSDSSFLPLPVEEERYRRKAQETEGLTLVSYRKDESADEVLITVRYEFSNPEALNRIISSSDENSITIDNRAGSFHYTQTIYDNEGVMPDNDVLKLTEALFSDRFIKIKVTAPSAVRTISNGFAGGSNAEAVFSIPELLSSDAPVRWEFTW